MALTTKLITANTAAAAIALLVTLGATIWAVIEFAPERSIPSVEPDAADIVWQGTAPHAQPDLVFAPSEHPADPAQCASIAREVTARFEVLAAGVDVEVHTHRIASLVNDYIGVQCPHAIHQGDWHITAQILSVGVIYEALRPQSEIYVSQVHWDPRAEALVQTAATTFDVTSPRRMCDEALNQDGEPNALTGLRPACMSAFD